VKLANRLSENVCSFKKIQVVLKNFFVVVNDGWRKEIL
jgi:hypothetical protein